MYTQAIREAKVGRFTLALHFDTEPEDPRSINPLGKMVCWHGRYNLGETHGFDEPYFFEQWWEEQPEPKIRLPLYLYDHSGLTMNTVGFNCPWDSGQVGYIYLTAEMLEKERILPEHAEDALRTAVAQYDQFLRGEYYGYTVLDENGAHIDSCWGYDDEDYCWEEGRSRAKYCAEHDPRKISDVDALNRIYQLMDGEEWSSDTLDGIAEAIVLTGREIHEPGEPSDERCTEQPDR